MKVMTFNLRYHEPKDGDNAWPNRVSRVVKAIQANDPDVLGIQEGLYSMLVDLEQHLTSYDWVGEGRMGGRESEYCAIFYKKDRFELEEHGQYWLSETPEAAGSKSWDSSLPRICTWAKLKNIASGKSVLICNTHLDHRGAEAKLNGAKLIVRQMAQAAASDNIPSVLMGDMNSVPSDDPIRYLKGEREEDDPNIVLTDAYEKAQQPTGATFGGFVGRIEGEPIDYIFVSSDVVVEQTWVDRSQYDGGYPSDHYPVMSIVSMK